MFDEQQEPPAEEPPAGDRGAVEESINMPSRSGERADTEPVPATKGAVAGEAESSDSGKEEAV
jgi:hypothetical protein